MKKKSKNHCNIVRVESDGQITPKMQEELRALSSMPDNDIDTSDIPEITDWSKAVRGKDFNKAKK